jgi:predicted nucleic acid-binding protein
MTEKPSTVVVYLDAMAFIFAIEGEPLYSGPSKLLLDRLRTRPGSGVTSELTLAEALAGSDLPRSPPIKRAYLDLIVWSKFLDLVPISRDILYESADLRFAHRQTHGRKLKLPDAIHLVTAIRKNCRYFVSADRGIKPPVEMKRIAPDADGVDEILKVLV